MPTLKQAHVKRLYNADDHDIWIDVLRADKLVFQGRGDASQQHWETIRTYAWDDKTDENANKARKTHAIAIYDPTAPPNDDPQPGDAGTVSLWIADRLTTVPRGTPDGTHWATLHVYRNDPAKPTTRKVLAIRIVNNDLGGLDMTQGSVDWDKAYLDALQAGTTDDSQYLDVEDIQHFSYLKRGGPDQTLDAKLKAGEVSDQKNQEVTAVLQKKDFESLFSRSPDSADPKPLRLDPIQIVVNVGWGGLAVEFFDKDQ